STEANRSAPCLPRTTPRLSGATPGTVKRVWLSATGSSIVSVPAYAMLGPVTFFKRMFSADFRRAVAAEAAGDYAEAARAYALAGERVKVAEMHLLRAERAPSPPAKLHQLRPAVPWADPPDPPGTNPPPRTPPPPFTS